MFNNALELDWLRQWIGSSCGLALAMNWLQLWIGSGCGLAPAVDWLQPRTCAGSMLSTIKAKSVRRRLLQEQEEGGLKERLLEQPGRSLWVLWSRLPPFTSILDLGSCSRFKEGSKAVLES